MRGWEALGWRIRNHILPKVKIGQLTTKQRQMIGAANMGNTF